MTVTIRPPQPRDVERLSVILAPIDIAECRSAGHTPWQGLHRARQQSVMCWTGEVDGWPEAMFGVVPGSLATGLGYPWFLGSRKAREVRRLFLTDAPAFVARIEVLFPRLEGMISARNAASIRWLRRLGFVVDEKVNTIRGEPMRHFHKGF